MPDEKSVIEANRAFYRAFESLSLEKMEALWLREARIVCVHPGWRMLKGWGPIMNSWELIFDGVFEMKFEVNELSITMTEELAVVLVEENLIQRGYNGEVRTQVLATNVFERDGDRWWLAMHHGSPVLAPPDADPVLQ